jgi:pimeloyl-ACP methyl ester carboxylesterase
MRTRLVALLSIALSSIALASLPQGAHAESVVEIPVTFHVVNRNKTGIPCLAAPDGKTYPVHGSIIAPSSALSSPAGATLYLNGFGYGSWFLHFTDVPGYDYATQMAQAGHVSVLVDRLGNPAHDDLPDGRVTCLPAQADIAAQLIKALRDGSYQVGQGSAPHFSKVILAGHSAGGFITEIEQSTLKAADAVAVISYTDLPSGLALSTFAASSQDCLLAPQKSHGSTGAPNYAAFGKTEAKFVAGHFYNVDPAVAAAVLPRRNLDTCGELLNALQPLLFNQLGTSLIKSPVLLVTGGNDALFTPPSGKLQAFRSYRGSKDFTFKQLPGTGHAITLGRSHSAFVQTMDAWLSKHGA